MTVGIDPLRITHLLADELTSDEGCAFAVTLDFDGRCTCGFVFMLARVNREVELSDTSLDCSQRFLCDILPSMLEGREELLDRLGILPCIHLVHLEQLYSGEVSR